MNSTIRNILAVIAGLIVGNVINMGLISLSSSIVALPEGVDPSDINSINSNIHLYEAKHFIMPFLAHALGTLVGAYATVRFAANNHRYLALGIGAFFLIGGILVSSMINSPMWFTAVDLVLAYIPMALLGWMLAKKE